MTRHPGGRPRLPIDTTAVTTAYQEGRSVTEIARHLGRDRSVIRRVLTDTGTTLRDDRGAHWATKREAS